MLFMPAVGVKCIHYWYSETTVPNVQELPWEWMDEGMDEAWNDNIQKYANFFFNFSYKFR